MTADPRSLERLGDHALPAGYYDDIARTGSAIRRLWHVAKFDRVLDALPHRAGGSILDIGCFAGTFLSFVPRERFARQVGVDVLPEQIAYANERWRRDHREFRSVASLDAIASLDETFDCVTAIEVVEHLDASEIRALLRAARDRLRPGGKLLLTTPNYASTWPLLEILLNRFSDVSYAERHVTKFTFFDFARKLVAIHPELVSDFPIVDFKTTTHFVAPFLAAFSFDLARRASRAITHRRWQFPFGNMVLMRLTRAC